MLENKTLDLQTPFGQARTLDIAQKSSEFYTLPFMPTAAAIRKPSEENPQRGEIIDSITVASS